MMNAVTWAVTDDLPAEKKGLRVYLLAEGHQFFTAEPAADEGAGTEKNREAGMFCRYGIG